MAVSPMQRFIIPLAAQPVQGQNQGTGRRQAHYAESRLSLGRYGAIALRVEKNRFRVGDPERDYDELLGSLTFTGRF